MTKPPPNAVALVMLVEDAKGAFHAFATYAYYALVANTCD